MGLPIKDGKITTHYKKLGKMWSKGYHTGVDFACKEGTEIIAVADGKIEPANWGKSYGIQAVQKVEGGWVIYAHLSKLDVKAGDVVKAGKRIGASGNTGNSSGPHLHFEMRNNIRWSAGQDLDPSNILGVNALPPAKK
jgi:murein DD-endopeptidase MepM/ murein hydrolase activator NlpD